MRRRTLLALLAGSVCLPASAANDGLIEPGLHIVPGGETAPRVALTLDACMGGVDHRILDVLVERRIAATLFLTGRWLSTNSAALETLLAHPDLFELENHGAMHVPAVLGAQPVYGIRPAGTLTAIRAEVSGG
ncbi:MAG TPA: polysaccharide deacetylase family protein, partial [Devosiaceae bacterium]